MLRLRKIISIALHAFKNPTNWTTMYTSKKSSKAVGMTATGKTYHVIVSRYIPLSAKKNWDTKEDKGKSMMHVLYILWLLKRHAGVLGQSDIEQERNQTCIALSSVESCLAGSVSCQLVIQARQAGRQAVSQLVENSYFYRNLL